MERNSIAMIFLRGRVSMPVRQSAFIKFALPLSLSAGMLLAAQTRVVVILPKDAGTVEKVAAEELTTHLHALYPSTAFRDRECSGGSSGYLSWNRAGVAGELCRSRSGIKLAKPDSFAIKVIDNRMAVIAGASPRASCTPWTRCWKSWALDFIFLTTRLRLQASRPFRLRAGR